MECALPSALNFKYRCGPWRLAESWAQAHEGSPHCRVISESEPCTIDWAAPSSSAMRMSLLLMPVKVSQRQRSCQHQLQCLTERLWHKCDACWSVRAETQAASLYNEERDRRSFLRRKVA